jgi:hypothetical protein
MVLHMIQSDVTPALIMSRVEAASGAKYSTHQERPRKYEPIAPVGTNYTPIGKVDIASLRKGPSDSTSGGRGGESARFGAPRPSVGYTPSAASSYGRTVVQGSAPVGSWPCEPSAPTPLPPPTAPHSPMIPLAPQPTTLVSLLFCPCKARCTNLFPLDQTNATSPASRAVPTAPGPVPASNVPTKPADNDRIAPVGTAYTPVSLPAPKKLKNPFEAFEQPSQSHSSPQSQRSLGASGAKKLTWSERQVFAKKQAEEEEARNHDAAFQPAPAPVAATSFTSSAPLFGRAVPTAPPVAKNFGGVAAGGDAVSTATAAVREAVWGGEAEEEAPYVSSSHF